MCYKNQSRGFSTYHYPNPSKDGVFLLNKESNWDVFSVQGIKIKEGKSKEIDLSTAPKGIYLLNSNGNYKKLIIE
ncbi:MAG: T9SS type A sorting domain-containing protein [Flavobacterium sp.]|nr:T9SS type A sorting domain-containing protein [Flavobacterium sp.]